MSESSRIDRLEEEVAYLKERVSQLEGGLAENTSQVIALVEANRIQTLALKKLAKRESKSAHVFNEHDDPVPKSG